MQSDAFGTPAALRGKFLSAAVTGASVRSGNCRETAFKLSGPEVMCNSDKALVQLWKPVLEATGCDLDASRCPVYPRVIESARR